MTVQDLGAIGELIGSLAVLVTLVYLARQIRQGNRNTEIDSRQTILHNFFEKAHTLAEDTELRRIVMSALNDFHSLSNEEKYAWDALQMWYWGNLHQALFLKEQKLIDDESFSIIAQAFVGGVNTPGGRDWWSEAKKTPGMSERVIKYVEEKLPETRSSWLDLNHLNQTDA
jgi:hypothetical protein